MKAEPHEYLFRLPAIVLFPGAQAQADLIYDVCTLKLEMLVHMTDGIIFRYFNAAVIWFIITKDHAKERGFTVTIPAYNAYLLSPVKLKADAIKKGLRTVGFFQFDNRNHKGSNLFFSKYSPDSVDDFRIDEILISSH